MSTPPTFFLDVGVPLIGYILFGIHEEYKRFRIRQLHSDLDNLFCKFHNVLLRGPRVKILHRKGDDKLRHQKPGMDFRRSFAVKETFHAANIPSVMHPSCG